MKHRDLPLVALRAFAVAAQTGSITRAAAELAVTHGAVSKQIAALEDWLGQKLFLREGRRIALTPYGQILSSKLAESITDMAAACDYVRRRRTRPVIAVEGPATFAMYWLMPRLVAFEAHEPNVEVWISTRMSGQAPDFAANDVVITRGPFANRSARLPESTPLFEERMTLIASPLLLERHPIASPPDILRERLIVSATRPDDWPRWLERVGLAGHFLGGGHRFDHLFVALHAVRDGIGPIVAPENVLSIGIGRGEFTCPLPGITFAGEVYTVHHPPRSRSKHVDRFLEWLRQAG